MRPAKPNGAVLLVIAAFLLVPSPLRPEPRDNAPTEDELFSKLFGEEPPAESPDDILVLEAIRVERPDSFTQEYILSFARELEVGKSYERSGLQRRIAAIDERLRLSGRFYSSLASYRELGTGEEAGGPRPVEVLLSVSEGFPWGFNFRPWDISITYGNIAKAGKIAALTLGLNSQEIAWTDPAIRESSLYYSVDVEHSIKRYTGDIDPDYLAALARVEARVGVRPTENLRIGVGAGYLGIDSPAGYFLYPDYDAPGKAELAGLGLSRSRADFAEALLDIGLLEYDYRREGGLRARLVSGALIYVPLRSGGERAIKLFADGALRYDTPSVVSLVARERIESFPWAKASADIPAPLRADLDECRCAGGLSSGEFSSLTRLGLDCDFGESVQLGFTSLSVVPELYYELAFAARASYSGRMTGRQGCGFVLRFEFAAPINRVFILGMSLGLPGLPGFAQAEASGEELAMSLVFEVE
jgi:hypothetical protein